MTTFLCSSYYNSNFSALQVLRLSQHSSMTELFMWVLVPAHPARPIARYRLLCCLIFSGARSLWGQLLTSPPMEPHYCHVFNVKDNIFARNSHGIMSAECISVICSRSRTSWGSGETTSFWDESGSGACNDPEGGNVVAGAWGCFSMSAQFFFPPHTGAAAGGGAEDPGGPGALE